MDTLLPATSTLTLASYPLHQIAVGTRPSPRLVRDWMALYHRAGCQMVPFLLIQGPLTWRPLGESSAALVLALAGVGEAWGDGLLVVAESTLADHLQDCLEPGRAAPSQASILSPLANHKTLQALLGLDDVGDLLRHSEPGPGGTG